MAANARRTVQGVRLVGCVLATSWALSCFGWAQGLIEPEASWSVRTAFDNRKEAENVSGVACAPAELQVDRTRRCLLVSDEVSGQGRRYVRFFSVEEGDRSLSLGPTLELLPGSIGGEADVEGAAFDAGHFYVVGSHALSVGRTNPPEYQPSRFHLFRFAPDAAQVERRSLESVLARAEFLPEPDGPRVDIGRYACTAERWQNRACTTLQEQGLNVEGLAVWNGQLYLGLRAPVLGGRAFVVRLAVDSVFGTADSSAARSDVMELPTGNGVGIRDIARVANGFLVLTGPELPEADDRLGSAQVFFWPKDAPTSRGGEPRRLGSLGGMRVGEKPEALLVLGEDARGYRVLVFSDGTERSVAGRPTEYWIAKP